jgi:hypothetical protein
VGEDLFVREPERDVLEDRRMSDGSLS